MNFWDTLYKAFVHPGEMLVGDIPKKGHLGPVPRHNCTVIRTYFGVHMSVQSHVTNLRVRRIATTVEERYELNVE